MKWSNRLTVCAVRCHWPNGAQILRTFFHFSFSILARENAQFSRRFSELHANESHLFICFYFLLWLFAAKPNVRRKYCKWQNIVMWLSANDLFSLNEAQPSELARTWEWPWNGRKWKWNELDSTVKYCELINNQTSYWNWQARDRIEMTNWEKK